ncbi:MAG: Nif3-like dinuclear metal center hexameric protein [Gammaproteobacteria bacterium]|nr:Nif3-like dinuclear metal center hexameric protein [Gammaproteobacteria bacterium]
MVQRKELLEYLQELLKVRDFSDYCPNGLQLEGTADIKHIVAGVTASQALIDRAIAVNADAVLVHHGYFWKGESPAITGMKQKRIKALLTADINLLAYHLPLDCHPELGNNAQLAKQLGIEVLASHSQSGVNNLLWQGCFQQAQTPAELNHLLQQKLGREALWLSSDTNQPITTVAWCTGGAQSYIEAAAELGVDAYISGEVSEQTLHQARELDIHYFSAGHHATERYGVQALATHLQETFSISCEFVDLDNPV